MNTELTDFALEQLAGEFSAAQERGQLEHRLFDAPRAEQVVRLADTVKRKVNFSGWLDADQARKEVEGWKDRVRQQAQESANENAKKVVLSLFDYTGNWSGPWEEAGYSVLRFDIQENQILGDVNAFSVEFFHEYFGDFEGLEVYAILAACPCTEFASSGARHFAAKDEDGRTAAAIELVMQTIRLVEYYRPVVWAIENPVGRIGRLCNLPPWRLSFDPNHLGDPYTKKTLIWGRFNADLPVAPVIAVEGSKMHQKYGGKSLATKNARSVTPEGFSYGFFLANNAIDNPMMAIFWKYDRLKPYLLRSAVHAGVTEEKIAAEIEDFYFDCDDEAAENALRDLAARQLESD